MGKFIFGKSFGENNGIKKHNINVLDTPYNPVIAYQVEFDKTCKTVCFPYVRDLPKEDGFRVVEIEDFVPEEQRETVSEILGRAGYMGDIKW
ncbi:MAG: hypothetical protein NTY20_03350 [Candidatus Aenigmarchaeota archaeon]|nr:hypothetical protein [Candidatus Aenigmarchaeota archaeon]